MHDATDTLPCVIISQIRYRSLSLDLTPLSFARFAGRDLTVRGSILSGVD